MRCLAPLRAPATWLLFSVCPALPALAEDAPSPADTSGAEPKAPAPTRAELLRRSNSYLGPVGGIHVIEAGSGAPGSFRLQVVSDFFLQDDYLFDDDETRYLAGALSLSVTPIEHLEVTAAVAARSVWSSRPRSALLPNGVEESAQAFGDPYLDIKSYGEVADGVTLGGDVLLNLLTSAREDELEYAGTSFGVRGNLSLDLRAMKAEVPLELRLNAGYYFDQSRKVVEDIERDRRTLLAAQGGVLAEGDEYRHFARRNERLAYLINRVDHASIALGLEAPIALSRRAALHPIAEWELWIPVNRQDFDCPFVRLADGRKLPGDDSCLDQEGVDTWPQRITAGARLFPALGGFSLLAAVELGLGGSTNFVRELAPTPQYRVFLAASYAVDVAPKPTVVVKEVQVPVAPPEGHIRGLVVEQASRTPIADARVSFPGRGLNPVLTDARGVFVSYDFAPGAVAITVEAEGYEPGRCGAEIPAAGGDVPVTCELVALPLVGSIQGRVLDAFGGPLAGAQVVITGLTTRSSTASATGQFAERDLPPGEYRARVDQPGYLIASVPFTVAARRESPLELRLLPTPTPALIKVEKAKLRLSRPIEFVPGGPELAPSSAPLLAELADLLLRDATLLQLEVQGHSAEAKDEGANLELSQQRAESVTAWLIEAGVPPDRLITRGYGSAKRLSPGATPAARAKNSRIELVILQRAGEPAAVPASPRPQARTQAPPRARTPAPTPAPAPPLPQAPTPAPTQAPAPTLPPGRAPTPAPTP